VYVLAPVQAGGTGPTDVNWCAASTAASRFRLVRVSDDLPPPLRGRERGSIRDDGPLMGAHAVAPNGRIDAIWLTRREAGDQPVLPYYAYRGTQIDMVAKRGQPRVR
jgi:hypothetical protein